MKIVTYSFVKNPVIKAPIIFIVFNRSETTKLVFEKIRSAKPKRLYIAADGPRKDVKEESEKCEGVRRMVENVDWDCEVFRRYAQTNLGCGVNVSSAISWIFEFEDRAIVLEDDTMPTLSFFSFCEELLERYKDDPRVMHISGSNFNEDFSWNNDSYYFSMYTPIWGWATWKRAWKHFDYYMPDLMQFLESKSHKNILLSKREQTWFENRWDGFVKTNYSNTARTNWDYQWAYAVLKNSGLSIIPKSNLVSNIGIVGTHTKGEERKLFNRSIDENFKIQKHPDFVIRNRFYDKLNSKRFSRERTLASRIINRIRKILNPNV